MKRVACYCRVSTEEQVKYGFSIQAQKDALTKYCKENGYKYDFYIDEGISASSMKKRDSLNEMLSKCNVYDMILFTKLDRLSRNVLDANNINKTLKDNNCTMKAIDEDDIDTSTADGTFIFNLKVSLAQREIGKTSERINFVFKNKREKGEVTSGQSKYGYDIVNKHFVINEQEANNIRQLYDYFIDMNGDIKKTYDYFIQHFNGKGYDAMRLYLRDSSYIGKYKLYRKNEYIDNYIPAILDEEIFNKAQNLRKKRCRHTHDNFEALFAGLLFCNNCKFRLSKSIDYRVKTKVIRYCCTNSSKYVTGTKQKRCKNNKYIREEYIENYLLDNLSAEAEKYIIKTKEIISNTKITNNTEKIKAISKKIDKIKDLYLEDLIDKDRYKRDYTKYVKELEELQSTNIEPPKRDFSNLESIINSNFREIYNKLSTTNKRKFWLNIIDKIYIDNAEIKEITFL